MKRKQKQTKEEFLLKFKEKYPNYKILEFKNLNSSMIFEDDKGYIYKQQAYRTLLFKHNIQSIVNKEKYLQDKISLLFPNLKLLKYNGMKEKVLVIDENSFTYSPSCYDLLQGHPVSIQTCNEKEELFKFKANKKHNNFYKYEDFKFLNGKQKINIICPIHEVFNQLIEVHLYGCGCPKCPAIGFSKESWLKRLKNKNAIFYIIRLFKDDEQFLKIGITSKSVYERYKNLKSYKYEIIKEIINNPSSIYDLEKTILKEFKTFKYYPKHYFEGQSECLNIICLDKILKKYGDKNLSCE